MTRKMSRRPSFFAVLRLRCPYCRKAPLLAPKSWIVFASGCPKCDYPYEREEGYFTGAAWVINYTFAAFWGVLIGGLLLWQRPQWGSLLISLITAVVALLAAIGFFPYGKALWLWLDHVFHPLEERETLRSRSEGT